MLIIDVSASGQTNALFDLINHQHDVHKICLYTQDLYEGKYH